MNVELLENAVKYNGKELLTLILKQQNCSTNDNDYEKDSAAESTNNSYDHNPM